MGFGANLLRRRIFFLPGPLALSPASERAGARTRPLCSPLGRVVFRNLAVHVSGGAGGISSLCRVRCFAAGTTASKTCRMVAPKFPAGLGGEAVVSGSRAEHVERQLSGAVQSSGS